MMFTIRRRVLGHESPFHDILDEHRNVLGWLPSVPGGWHHSRQKPEERPFSIKSDALRDFVRKLEGGRR